jgi:hypothetical protein
MSKTLVAPLAAHALARPSHPWQQGTGVVGGWLASFVAARERKAAQVVLRHLVEHIPHAADADRTRLEALAASLRRSLPYGRHQS